MPLEVVLMMDMAGVLTTSPFPASRRLAENMMRCVFERAGTHILTSVQSHSVAFLACKYSNFFFTVIEFSTKTRGIKGAFERLELGEINRLEFIRDFQKEISFMLEALLKESMEELDALGIAYPTRITSLRKRYPLLCNPIVQTLIKELLDVEAFLCTLERVSLRKNVLNLLHYLRVKSQQEIRLFAIGNTWEFEGQYCRMLKAMLFSTADAVSTAFPIRCPIEYGKSRNSFFHVNSLFDGHIQSHLLHKCKPYPDIYMHAIDTVMRTRAPFGDALRHNLKPNIFYFDDVAAHCEAARQLPGSPFTEVFFIDNGALDVYNDIVAALKSVAARDEFWAEVVKGVEEDIGPFFKSTMNPQGKHISWVEEELNNYNHNLLFMPPPPCDMCVPVDTLGGPLCSMSLEDRDGILYYCAQHLPHLFPLSIPDNPTPNMRLWEQPGFATSAGPITFEFFVGDHFFESYRVTLRTGSYVLRIQPRGPSSFGFTDIHREYQIMEHLHEMAPSMQVPQMLIYCDTYAVCGRRFLLRRFRDGEAIVNIQQLIQPRVYRPYSHSRRRISVELNPRLFYRAAIGALVSLHDAPLPRFLKQQEEKLRRSKSIVHPLLSRIEECMLHYNLTIQDVQTMAEGYGINLNLESITALEKGLVASFDRTQLSHPMVPMPERFVVVHGNFDMSALIFTHRSLEGRSKYPPSLIGTTRFKFTGLDDPLLDVASLALFTYITAPEGIYDHPSDVQHLFPSPGDILDDYCNRRGYMRYLDQARRENIFKVYLAALCLQRAALAVIELVLVLRKSTGGLVAYSETRRLSFAEHMARRGLELLASRQVSKL